MNTPKIDPKPNNVIQNKIINNEIVLNNNEFSKITTEILRLIKEPNISKKDIDLYSHFIQFLDHDTQKAAMFHIFQDALLKHIFLTLKSSKYDAVIKFVHRELRQISKQRQKMSMYASLPDWVDVSIAKKMCNEEYLTPVETQWVVNTRLIRDLGGCSEVLKFQRKQQISFEEILEEDNADDNKKINIYISAKDGIYIDKKRKYLIKKDTKRLKYILTLKTGSKKSKQLNTDLSLVNKEIGSINKLFKRNLLVNNDIIVKIPTGGWELNSAFFEFNFLDE